MTLHVTCLIIAVVNTCMWLSLPLSSTLCSSLSRVPRYRTFTPRWCNTEVRVAPSIGTAAWSRQSFSYHAHTHRRGQKYNRCHLKFHAHDRPEHDYSTQDSPLLESEWTVEKQPRPTTTASASEPPQHTQRGNEHLQQRQFNLSLMFTDISLKITL